MNRELILKELQIIAGDDKSKDLTFLLAKTFGEDTYKPVQKKVTAKTLAYKELEAL